MAMMFRYVGWQIGINYQTKNKEGLDKIYLENLLGEMKENGMNFISFMMISHKLNDPIHDGYAWPVRNPKMKCYVDKNCINANPKREFLSETIEQSADYGFHINLFTNQFWWNPEKVKIGYPNIRSIESPGNKTKENQNYHHCSDNKDTWRLSCDEVKDLLGYYSSSAIKSYGFEMLGQEGCTCPDTLKMFSDELENKQELWQDMRKKEVIEEFVLFIKKIKPNIKVWHHGYMELKGNTSPESYRKAGIEVAIPCIHTVTDEDMLKKVLESSKDFPLVLHIDTRDNPTLNYPIPLKTPEYILKMGEWIEKNNRENLIGVVFFNEVATSNENKRAVYKLIKKWKLI